LTGRVIVSTIKAGVGGEFPRLRALIRIAKHIVELERFGEMWRSFVGKRKFGASVANSLREHWGVETLSAHSIFENKNHRILVERLQKMAERLRGEGHSSLADALENVAASYHLASTLPDGTFLPCSAWTWTLYSYRGGKGVPPAFITYVERDWATRDLLNELFRRAGISEDELDKTVTELIRRGKEPENVIKQFFE
ncbi:MAG: glycosidase, partial [Candidatus Freyarchaeota archaeon]|nr:glycosidase [Candidatus Jordarchaeia archaeon]